MYVMFVVHVALVKFTYSMFVLNLVLSRCLYNYDSIMRQGAQTVLHNVTTMCLVLFMSLTRLFLYKIFFIYLRFGLTLERSQVLF